MARCDDYLGEERSRPRIDLDKCRVPIVGRDGHGHFCQRERPCRIHDVRTEPVAANDISTPIARLTYRLRRANEDGLVTVSAEDLRTLLAERGKVQDSDEQEYLVKIAEQAGAIFKLREALKKIVRLDDGRTEIHGLRAVQIANAALLS